VDLSRIQKSDIADLAKFLQIQVPCCFLCNPLSNGYFVETVLCKNVFIPKETIDVNLNLGPAFRVVSGLSLSLLVEISLYNTNEKKISSIVQTIYHTKKKKPFVQKEVLLMDLLAVMEHMSKIKDEYHKSQYGEAYENLVKHQDGIKTTDLKFVKP
jgi:hypothetical protein